MTVRTTFAIDISPVDARDTLNQMLADIAALKGGTPTPTPAPTLNGLGLSSTTFQRGTAKTVDITNATSGSALAGSSLPSGFTVDSSARKLAFDGSGSGASSLTIALIETLAGATNSPRRSDVPATMTEGAAPTPTPSPTERQFSYAETEPGWTLVRSDKDSGFLQLNNKADMGSASHYAAVITGTAAAAKLEDFFKTSPADRAADLYFEVSVDGGAYTRTPYNATQDDYQLFTGLSDVPHVVALRTPAARDQFVKIPKDKPPLRVTGGTPALRNVTQWLQPGVANANVQVASSLITINDLLDANSGNLWRPQRFNHYLPGGVPSIMFRAEVSELVFVTGQRMVHVWDGTSMTVVDTGTDVTAVNSTAVRVARLTGLSGLKTYWVWTSNNESITYFAVGLVGGTAVTPTVAKRTLDQYGDSITAGSATEGVGATTTNKLHNGRGYVDTFRVAARLGYTGSACGVGGYSVADLNNNIADWLAPKAVTSADVALLAIGQNGGVPDTSVYNAIIDKLLAKGYGKVICRGVIPVIGGGSDAINVTISNIVSARNDPKVKYMNVSTWTNISRPDNIHPDFAGYAQMVDLGVPALQSLGV